MSDMLTLEQKVYIYDTFVRTENTKKVKHKFKKKYPDVDPLHKTTILKLVIRFRKTGSLAGSVENKRTKKSDESRKTSGKKKKTQKTNKNISRDTDISKTSGKRVTRLSKQIVTNKNVNEVQESLPDDQEPTFETINIDSNEASNLYIPEDCSAVIKSEPLIEYVGDEDCCESEICKMIKHEPASEDTEMEDMGTANVNGRTIKTEPTLDRKPLVANKLKSGNSFSGVNGRTIKTEPTLDRKPLVAKSGNSFSGRPKLLEDQIKQELVEDDETINEI